MNFDPRIIAISIAAIIGAVGAVMLARGLRALNKGVRSCPRCHHLLSGTKGLRCPECGHLARNEHALLRANRRRFPALVGLLLLIGSIFLVQRLDQAQQMFALVPDRFLVMLLPYASATMNDDGIHAELHDRARSGVLDTGGRERLLERIISGDGSATPGTEEWELKYAPLAFALRSGLYADDPLHERFAEITPLVKMNAPDEWPPGTPAVILIDVIRFDSNEEGARVWIKGLPGGPRLFMHHRLNRSGFPLALTLEEPGELGIDQSLTLTIDTSAEGTLSHERTIDVDVDPAPLMLSGLEPRDSPMMRRVLEQSVFRFGVALYEQGDPPWSLRFSPRSTRGSAFSGVLIGLEIELLREGVPARRSFIWWHGSVGNAAWETVFEDQALLENASRDEANWTLRISGRKEIALRALIANPPAADSWWSGTFEIPVETRETPGSIPPREWEPAREHAHDEPTC